MTMKAMLVNAGNRTGDKLHVAVVTLELDSDGEIEEYLESQVELKRGETFDLLSLIGHHTDQKGAAFIKMWAGDSAGDEFVGNPQVLVGDLPKKL